MRRLAASVTILAFVLVTGLAFRAQAQGPNRAYLPLVGNPPPTATPTRAPTASPTIAPTPAPFFGDCFVDPDPRRAPNYPVQIFLIDEITEAAWLRNLGTERIEFDDWSLCSINGNERFDLSDLTLNPGQSFNLIRSGSDVFENFDKDDAALYDPSGRLIAYFVD